MTEQPDLPFDTPKRQENGELNPITDKVLLDNAVSDAMRLSINLKCDIKSACDLTDKKRSYSPGTTWNYFDSLEKKRLASNNKKNNYSSKTSYNSAPHNTKPDWMKDHEEKQDKLADGSPDL